MEIIEVNQDNFEEEVLNTEGKVLVDFNANWCGPCRMLKPLLEEIANESNIKVISINIDEEEELSRTYKVFSIPCLILFENGKEMKRSIGFIPKEEIESMIGEQNV